MFISYKFIKLHVYDSHTFLDNSICTFFKVLFYFFNFFFLKVLLPCFFFYHDTYQVLKVGLPGTWVRRMGRTCLILFVISQSLAGLAQRGDSVKGNSASNGCKVSGNRPEIRVEVEEGSLLFRSCILQRERRSE